MPLPLILADSRLNRYSLLVFSTETKQSKYSSFETISSLFIVLITIIGSEALSRSKIASKQESSVMATFSVLLVSPLDQQTNLYPTPALAVAVTMPPFSMEITPPPKTELPLG